MKCIKRILFVLAALFLMLPAVQVQAAEKNYVEVKSGSTSAKVTFVVENVLALEASASTAKTTGFKVSGIDVSGTEAGSLTLKSDGGDKVVVVGSSTPADIKLTVSLESAVPMKDGTYTVKLTYGVTNKNGSFSTGMSQTATIYVGKEAPKEEEAQRPTTGTSTNTGSQTQLQNPDELNADNSAADESDRTDMLDMADTSALIAALEEAEELQGKKMNSSHLERLLIAIEGGYVALESDDQAVIDEAAISLNDIITEIGAAKGDSQKGSSGFKMPSLPLWLILVIIGIILTAVTFTVTWFIMKKRKVKDDFDGAPMVDYEISDDDEQ